MSVTALVFQVAMGGNVSLSSSLDHCFMASRRVSFVRAVQSTTRGAASHVSSPGSVAGTSCSMVLLGSVVRFVYAAQTRAL